MWLIVKFWYAFLDVPVYSTVYTLVWKMDWRSKSWNNGYVIVFQEIKKFSMIFFLFLWTGLMLHTMQFHIKPIPWITQNTFVNRLFDWITSKKLYAFVRFCSILLFSKIIHHELFGWKIFNAKKALALGCTCIEEVYKTTVVEFSCK